MNAPLPILTEARARELLETARMRRQINRPVEVAAHELEALCVYFTAVRAAGVCPADQDKPE